MSDQPVQPAVNETEFADEITKQLRRIQSEVGFRLWVRRIIVLLIALIVLSLSGNAVATVAILRENHNQHIACQRDDALRLAYTTQWQPLLDQAKQKDDPQSRATVALFQVGLDGFKIHGC